MNLNPKRLAKMAAVLAVNLAVLAALLEATGFVVYLVQTGRCYYGRAGGGPTGLPAAQPATMLREPMLLHPYFGYVFPPDLTVPIAAFNPGTRALYAGDPARPVTAIHINNFGFVSDVDYPYARRGNNELVVGVFGGSVAHFFALQGAETLRVRLAALLGRRAEGITVLDMAMSGYKQPQQLLMLAYLLSVGQQFDAIVNVDGVNELAWASINHDLGFDVSMPNTQHVLPLLSMLDRSALTPSQIESLCKLRQLRGRLDRWDALAARTRSAALHLVSRVLGRRSERQYRSEAVRYEKLAEQPTEQPPVLYLWRPGLEARRTNAIAEAFAVWGDASLAMQRLCRSSGIPYLEVVQPNQYDSHKILTPAERARAINPLSPFKGPVELGYPFVGDFIRTMQRKGVNVVSALALFDDRPEPIYLDDCCHYNYEGYRLLGEFVADHLAPVLTKPPMPSGPTPK